MEDEITSLMNRVALKLKKSPDAMQPFVQKLNDNWYDSVDSLREIDDETWNNVLKFPSRLVKVIKDEISTSMQVDDGEEMIDTTKPFKEPTPLVPQIKPIRDIHMENNDDQEQTKENDEPLKDDYFGEASVLLNNFYQEAGDDVPTILATLKTLTKVLENLLQNSMEPKYRSLNATKKPVQEKLLKYTSIVSFLKLAGFEDKGDEYLVKGYPSDRLQAAHDSILTQLKENSDRFGVTVKSGFDPYKEGVISRAGNNISTGKTEASLYNPSYIDQMIQEEMKLKKKLMERTVDDREIKVFNTMSGTTNIQQVMRAYEEENKKEDEEYEEELRKKFALKFIGEQNKNQKFGNKRLQEYNKIRDRKVYSTTIIRVKFADGLILQGKFGAREKVSAVYDFVLENLLEKERGFYLYKAPPKKIISNKKETLKALDLIPSGMIFFSWEDEDLKDSSSSIALDMNSLKDKVEVF